MHDFTLADQDWIGLMIFKNLAEQDWIGFNFLQIRIGLRLKNLSVRSSLTATINEHGSGLDRTGSGLTPISAGTRLQFFWKLADRTGSDWENFWCFCAIILNISKILVVIWFYRFAKWQCIFCHQWQKLWWDYFAIRTVGYPPLSIHNVEF